MTSIPFCNDAPNGSRRNNVKSVCGLTDKTDVHNPAHSNLYLEENEKASQL